MSRRRCGASEICFHTGPGEVYVQSYSHAKFKQYAVDWYLGAPPVTRRGGAAFGGAAPAAEMDRS